MYFLPACLASIAGTDMINSCRSKVARGSQVVFCGGINDSIRYYFSGGGYDVVIRPPTFAR